ncbi:hypothetical protein ACP70R_041566 [Stipagrostis hirtigluma subsp. patula]
MSMMPWFGGREGMDLHSSDLWDPFGASGLWDSGLRRGGGNRDEAAAVARTNVDWRETDKEHIFTAEIPGVRKEDVKVEVEDGSVLKISGEKAREAAEEREGGSWVRVERSFGSFQRRFRLPDGVRTDGIRCVLEDAACSGSSCPRTSPRSPAASHLLIPQASG